MSGTNPGAKVDPASEQDTTHADGQEVKASRDDLWMKLGKSIQDQDMQMVRRWEEEMDNLLVFAGLSSAILTAFVIESWPLLQPDSGDATVLLLARISQQLDSFSVSTRYINSTQPSLPTAAMQIPIPASAIRINVLWFASLTLCLASALGSILVKQWLREYRRTLQLPPSLLNLQLRQFQYDGLKRWGVPTFTAVLPTLLQVAIALFWGGLVDLLWTLENTLAIVLSALICVCLAGALATFILPAIFSDCAYKSPAAWACVKLVLLGKTALGRLLRVIYSVLVTLELDEGENIAPLISRLPSLTKRLSLALRPYKTWQDLDLAVLLQPPLEIWRSRTGSVTGMGHATNSLNNVISGKLVAWVASALRSHDLEHVLTPCITILEPATRVEVAFSITARQLGFADPVALRRSLRSNSGTISNGQWFWDSRRFSVGSSAELALLLDVAPFARCSEGDTSTTSVLDVLLLFQQLVRELPKRSRLFDERYIEFLVGTPWELDSAEDFSNTVRKVAAQSLREILEHEVTPNLPSISVEHVLQLPSLLLERINKRSQEESYIDNFKNVYTQTLEFLPRICSSSSLKKDAPIKTAIQTLVGLINSIRSGDPGSESIAFPSAVKTQWLMAITRIARTNRELLPADLGASLYHGCMQLEVHHETSAIKQLLRACQYRIKEDDVLDSLKRLGTILRLKGDQSLVSFLDHRQVFLRKALKRRTLSSMGKPVNDLIAVLRLKTWLCPNDSDISSAFDILREIFVYSQIDGSARNFLRNYLRLLAESISRGPSEYIRHKAVISLGVMLQLHACSIPQDSMLQICRYALGCCGEDMTDPVKRSKAESLTALALHAFAYQQTSILRHTTTMGSSLQYLMQLHTELIKAQTKQRIKFRSNADFLLVLARAHKPLVPMDLIHALYTAHLHGLLLDSDPVCLRLSLKLSAKFPAAQRYKQAPELLWLEYSAELHYTPLPPAVQSSRAKDSATDAVKTIVTSSEPSGTDQNLDTARTPADSKGSATYCQAIICIQTILLRISQDPQYPQPESLVRQAEHLFNFIPSESDDAVDRWFNVLQKLKSLRDKPAPAAVIDWLYEELQVSDEAVRDGTFSSKAEDIVRMYRPERTPPLALWLRGQLRVIREDDIAHPLSHIFNKVTTQRTTTVAPATSGMAGKVPGLDINGVKPQSQAPSDRETGQTLRTSSIVEHGPRAPPGLKPSVSGQSQRERNAGEPRGISRQLEGVTTNDQPQNHEEQASNHEQDRVASATGMGWRYWAKEATHIGKNTDRKGIQVMTQSRGTPANGPGLVRPQKVHGSWMSWEPNPGYAPTPPSREVTLLVPEPPSPGLFGPSSRPSSPILDRQWGISESPANIEQPDLVEEHVAAPMEEDNANWGDLRAGTSPTAEETSTTPQNMPEERLDTGLQADNPSEITIAAKEASNAGDGSNISEPDDILEDLKSLPPVDIETVSAQEIPAWAGWQRGLEFGPTPPPDAKNRDLLPDDGETPGEPPARPRSPEEQQATSLEDNQDPSTAPQAESTPEPGPSRKRAPQSAQRSWEAWTPDPNYAPSPKLGNRRRAGKERASES